MQKEPHLVAVARSLSKIFSGTRTKVALVILTLSLAVITFLADVKNKTDGFRYVFELAEQYRASFAISIFVIFAIWVFHWTGTVDEKIGIAENAAQNGQAEIQEQLLALVEKFRRLESFLDIERHAAISRLNEKASESEIRRIDAQLNAAMRFLSESSQFQQRLTEVEESLRMAHGSLRALSLSQREGQGPT